MYHSKSSSLISLRLRGVLSLKVLQFNHSISFRLIPLKSRGCFVSLNILQSNITQIKGCIVSLNILQLNITQIERCFVSLNILQFNITQIKGVYCITQYPPVKYHSNWEVYCITQYPPAQYPLILKSPITCFLGESHKSSDQMVISTCYWVHSVCEILRCCHGTLFQSSEVCKGHHSVVRVIKGPVMDLVLDANGNESLRVRMTQAAPQFPLQSSLQD